MLRDDTEYYLAGAVRLRLHVLNRISAVGVCVGDGAVLWVFGAGGPVSDASKTNSPQSGTTKKTLGYVVPPLRRL